MLSIREAAMVRSSSAAGGYTRLDMENDDAGPEFSLPAPPAPIDRFQVGKGII